MRLGNQIIAGVFLLLGLMFVQQAPQYRLFTPDTGAGPGLTPLLTGAAMALTAVVLMVVAQRTEAPALEPGIIPERDGMIRLAGVLAALVAVVALMGTLGYRITMFLFLAFTIRLLGRFNPLLIMAIALAGSVGLYWLFNDRLMVVLPRGPDWF